MIEKQKSNSALRRGASRLAAVQALYQMEMSGARVDDVLTDFLTGAIGGEVIDENLDLETEEVVPLIEFNGEMFAVLLRGAAAMRERLDDVIAKSLSSGWEADRLEPILRSILRCGIYELLERDEVPPRVAISEYVGMARAFYDAPEAGMVNAVLDRLAREVRPDQMDAARSARPMPNRGGDGPQG
jgi:N utilization substance protein B